MNNENNDNRPVTADSLAKRKALRLIAKIKASRDGSRLLKSVKQKTKSYNSYIKSGKMKSAGKV